MNFSFGSNSNNQTPKGRQKLIEISVLAWDNHLNVVYPCQIKQTFLFSVAPQYKFINMIKKIYILEGELSPLTYCNMSDIYPLHTQCVVIRLCIRSSLLREPVSLRVVIVTSSDVGSGQDLIYSFVPTHYLYLHVKSLSNISIKTNFKQITRVESKLTNVYITLRVTTFCT